MSALQDNFQKRFNFSGLEDIGHIHASFNLELSQSPEFHLIWTDFKINLKIVQIVTQQPHKISSVMSWFLYYFFALRRNAHFHGSLSVYLG